MGAALLALTGACSFVAISLALGASAASSVVGLAGAARLVRGIRDGVLRLPPIRRARLLARRRELRASCLAGIPEFLDVLALGLSAGLSFDAALALFCERDATPLGGAMSRALHAWQIGLTSRTDALEGLARELEVPALGRFASAVSEALAFGIPLAAVLERQAAVIRDEQRIQAEERVEKAPVKMLLPLGTLVVPAMLLAILGPLLSSAFGG